MRTVYPFIRPAQPLLSIFCGLSLAIAAQTAISQSKPAIMQAQNYHDAIRVEDYWISEKLDGVRARWDGQRLISRNGKAFAAPLWFTEGFPNVVLDGELWSARGQYQKIASITAQQTPHAGWRNLKLMVFDMPEHGGTFSERVATMQTLSAAHLEPIRQYRIADSMDNDAELMQQLNKVVAAGGEGLMLHHQNARYEHRRSEHLFKLKQFEDADARVIGYKPGKGKYQGLTGSLKVQNPAGKVFYIGSGLSDAERANPPPLDSIISFKHQGLTDSGIPRFPVFIRVRND